MFTIDTNILIYSAAGDSKVSDFISQQLLENKLLCLSIISLIEFLSFPELTEKDRKFFKNISPYFRTLSVDFEIGMLSADLRRKYRLKLADSIIAATAINTQTTLITRNISDFKKISELKLLAI